MKNAIRAMFIVALLCISIMSAGCAKTFYFSFKDEGALFNESYTFLVEEGSPELVRGRGLTLDASRVIAPICLNGDVTITIRFRADCSEFELGYLAVHLWTGDPEVAHLVEFYFGNPVDQLYKLAELAPSYEIRAGGGPEIPGYHGTGDYVLRIEKKGDEYSSYLGTQLLGKYEAEGYFADWFYISLVGELYGLTTSDSLVIKDIKVSYDEGIILH